MCQVAEISMILTMVLASAMVWNQVATTPRAFEVVSVKHAAAVSPTDQCLCETPGRIAYRSAPVKWILERAYRLQDPQIAGPPWMDTETFDIDAKLPEGATAADIPAMLQTMLAARFGLAAHPEKREISAFVLTVGKGGSKLTAPQDDFAFSWRQDKRGIHLRQRMTMDDLGYYLSTQMEKPVVNETGVDGTFAIALDFAPLTLQTRPDAVTPLPQALQEQLGLKLESGKRPVPVLVVDRMARVPTEN
jgi:uncharacterized protein (TIGR03435 family)